MTLLTPVMNRPLFLVACASLASPLLAQTAAPTLVPAAPASLSWTATLNTTTGELSTPQAVAHPDAIHAGMGGGFISNFDNTLTPSGGEQVALLQPHTGLVDWGETSGDSRLEVKEVTIAYGADTENPDLLFGILSSYEGYNTIDFTDGFFPFPEVVGDEPTVESFPRGMFQLTGIPGDLQAPGDGQVVTHELTLTLDPPVPLSILDLKVVSSVGAFAEREHCFGWLYGTTTGGVGPVLVDTQCVPGDIGPNDADYELAMIDHEPYTGPLDPVFEEPQVTDGASMVGLTFAAESFSGHFSVNGYAVRDLYIHSDGIVGLNGPIFMDVACDLSGYFLCGPPAIEPGPTEVSGNPCHFVAPFWSEYRNPYNWTTAIVGGAGPTPGIYMAQLRDRFVVHYEQLEFRHDPFPGNPGVPDMDMELEPVTFQVHFLYCGNRIEFHYLTDVEAPEAFDGVSSFVGTLSGADGLFGDHSDLPFLCEGMVSAETSFAITRGPLPVVNGVTNKLDFHFADVVEADNLTGGSEPEPQSLVDLGYLFTMDFDSAGLGPIASTYLDATLGRPCGEARLTYLFSEEFDLGFPGVDVGLEASGRPVFGASHEFVVAPLTPLVSGYGAAALALTDPMPASPNPFGGLNPLWVDLDKITYFDILPLGPISNEPGGDPGSIHAIGGLFEADFGAVFPAIVPPFDAALCGTAYHVQGAVIGGGLNPILSNGLQLVLGFDDVGAH